jgi:hypothetical protein
MTSPIKFELSSFPYPVLSRTHEPGHKPTRERVLQTCLEVCSNAASVLQCTIGAEGFGLLGLVTTDADYLQVTGVAFIRPLQPAAAPNPLGTAAEIAAHLRAWQVDWVQYNLMRQVDTALRNQLLQSTDDIYWRPLFQPITGYGRRTANEFVVHLKEHYAAFDEQIRAGTVAAMETPWSGGPFEIPIMQIEEGASAFALAGQPFTDINKCDKLYTIAAASGKLSDACRLWRMTAAADKTWVACKEHFLKFADDYAQDATASSAGMVNEQVHHMAAATIALNESHQQMAMFAEHKSEADKAISDLQKNLASANDQLRVFMSMTNYQNNNGNYNNNNNNRNRNRNRNRNGNGNGNGNGFDQENGNGRDHWTVSCDKYCHTHGLNKSHNSPDCNKPATGHKSTATKSNRMKGRHADLH